MIPNSTYNNTPRAGFGQQMFSILIQHLKQFPVCDNTIYTRSLLIQNFKNKAKALR
jgi:hypothetical protein